MEGKPHGNDSTECKWAGAKRKLGLRLKSGAIIPVPELRYPGTAAAKWHFHQENATFNYRQEGTGILEPV
jgi:hypothetical protein